jgi:hypothetical protein
MSLSLVGLPVRPRLRRSSLVVLSVLLTAGSIPAVAQQSNGAGSSAPPSEQTPAPAPATPAATPVAAAPAAEAAPQESNLGFFKSVELGGLVDAYYDYYSTKPDGDAQFRNFDTKHNQFALSMAQLWLTKAPTADSRGGFRVKFNVGPAASLINAYEPGTADFLKNIEEGYASYLAPLGKGLQFDVGKFVTPNGAEVIESKDNWNYSRSLLFALAIPYYHSGVRMTYAPSDKVSIMGLVVNGWNNVVENNGGKTLGAQITVKPTAALSIVQNYMTGPEQPKPYDGHWRQLSDSIVTYTVSPAVSVMANYDYGHDDIAGVSGHWQGIAGYAKIQANKVVAFSPRLEFYDDAAGLTTGTIQQLKEVTGTVELKATDTLLCRIEYRTDFSDQAVFKNNDGAMKKNQSSIGVGVLYSFSFKGK